MFLPWSAVIAFCGMYATDEGGGCVGGVDDDDEPLKCSHSLKSPVSAKCFESHFSYARMVRSGWTTPKQQQTINA